MAVIIAYPLACDYWCEMGVIVSVCVSMLLAQTKTLLNPELTSVSCSMVTLTSFLSS